MDEYIYLWAQWGILDHKNHKEIIRAYGDLKNAWEKVDFSFLNRLFGSEKAKRVLEIRKKMDFYYFTRKMQKLGISVLSIDDKDYPLCLLNIDDPPPFLFILGKLPSVYRAIGIVGTRMVTDYGKICTESFTYDLVRAGFVIVSGLAIGVDTIAHTVTVENSGQTVAVLGCGVDNIYPGQNRKLAERILSAEGAIVSEYPIGTPALPHHFPMRNRIIAGLSKGVLVIEGGVKSGALITASYALNQGREVFAVPNNITKKDLSGTNYLIRNGEAKLVESASHIFEEFKMEPAVVCKRIEFTPVESELMKVISNEGRSLDELLNETSYNISQLSQALIGLHLKGAAREVGRKWVAV